MKSQKHNTLNSPENTTNDPPCGRAHGHSRNNLKGAFRTTLRVLSWGSEVFGWIIPTLRAGDGANLLQLIWKPLLEAKDNQELRTRLDTWKRCRAWVMKILGASEAERKVFRSNPPKGARKWVIELAENITRVTDPAKRRGVNTVMFSTRSIILNPEPDYETITQPGHEGPVTGIGAIIRKFWKILRVRPIKGSIPKSLRWKEWHLTSKQGPNGHALQTLLDDLTSLDEQDKQDLVTLGGEEFQTCLSMTEMMKPLVKAYSNPKPSPLKRKLAFFPDLEGKTRIIALMDYFSQSVLKPIHAWLFKILRRIKQDFTFNQGGFVEHTKGWEYYYSCDLTAATDRVPISLMVQLLKGILPEGWVDAWHRIMVRSPFRSSNGQDYSYATGNPMGAYSSWAMLAITHHFIVFWACQRINQRWDTAKYAILGDDILIGDPLLYGEYRCLLKLLQIPVSEAKTHESKILAEFAKRWLYEGIEVTPFPIPAMMEVKNEYSLTTLLVEEATRSHTCDIPSATLLWFKKLQKDRFRKGTRFRPFNMDRIECHSKATVGLLKLFRKQIPVDEATKEIYKGLTRLESESDTCYMTPEWSQQFWRLFLHDLWVRRFTEYMNFTMSTTTFGPGKDPYQWVMWARRNPDNSDLIKELQQNGWDMGKTPWIQLVATINQTGQDMYTLTDQILNSKDNSLDSWSTLRRIGSPDLALQFKGRKYNIVRVVSGIICRRLTKVSTGKERFYVDPKYFDPMQGNPPKGEFTIQGINKEDNYINPFTPLLGLPTWEGSEDYE